MTTIDGAVPGRIEDAVHRSFPPDFALEAIDTQALLRTRSRCRHVGQEGEVQSHDTNISSGRVKNRRSR